MNANDFLQQLHARQTPHSYATDRDDVVALRCDAGTQTRLEQMFVATLAIASLTFVAVAGIAGYLPAPATRNFLLAHLSLVGVFYVLGRKTQPAFRFSQPRLAVPLLMAAGLLLGYGCYFGDAVKPLFMLLYILAFNFAVLTLPLRWMLAIGGFYVACYAGVVGFSLMLRPEFIDLRKEIFRLLAVSLIYAWCIGIGSLISRLRSELTDALAKSQALARLDSLTGCLNYRSFLEALQVECARARRGFPLSIIFADIDHFKALNDKYGHSAGDVALKEIAAAIKDKLRATDYVARTGGEEFVILLAQTTLAEATALANRIRCMIEQLHIPTLPDNTRVSVSVGVTQYQADEAIESAIARADKAMYEAKHKGRNCVVSAD